MRWLAAVACMLLSACTQPPLSQPVPEVRPTEKTYGGGLAGEVMTEADWDAAVEYARRATVRVQVRGCQSDGTGSGIAIGPDRVLTNRHVVSGSRSLTVETDSGVSVDVTRTRFSSREDLAILELSTAVFDEPVRVAKRATLPGDLVMVMGFPLGGDFTVGRGHVIDMEGGDSSDGLIKASVDILPGNSGGPLLNTNGELVGVIRAIDLREGAALAVPASEIAPLLLGVGTKELDDC